MKSLILKDLYNIIHNAKSMFFVLAVCALAYIPSSGAFGYIVFSGILCSMMIVTTFAFDEDCRWEKHALIMPVSRKDLAASKFIVLFIFCLSGIILGNVVTLICTFIFRQDTLDALYGKQIFLVSAAGFSISEIFGSMLVPLVAKFGAEKGRMLIFICAAVPAAACFAAYKLLAFFGIPLTEQLFELFLYACLPAAVLWNFVMFQISFRIYKKKELQ